MILRTGSENEKILLDWFTYAAGGVEVLQFMLLVPTIAGACHGEGVI